MQEEFIKRARISMFQAENRKNMERLFHTINNDACLDKPDGWMVIKYKHKWMRPLGLHERTKLIITHSNEEYPNLC